jgi:hypothetical protein
MHKDTPIALNLDANFKFLSPELLVASYSGNLYCGSVARKTHFVGRSTKEQSTFLASVFAIPFIR